MAVKSTKRASIKKRTASTIPNLNPTFFWDTGSTGNQITAEKLQKYPYSHNAMIYACCSVIARNVKRLPRFVENTETKDRIDKSPWVALLSAPNPFMSRTTFFEAVTLSMLLPTKGGAAGGQCFVIPVSQKGENVDLARGEIPWQLWPYNDEQIEPWKQNGAFAGWKLMVQGKDPQYFKLNEIIRINNFNPYDWFKGLSPYTPAQIAVLSDMKSDVWNSRMFDNDAVPAGVLSTDSPLTPQQAKQAETSWYEKYGGPGNVRRIAVLAAGLKFQQMSVNAKDMEFSKMKEGVVNTLISVWGLNKIALGNYESVNYATIVEGRKMLWEDTYLPVIEQIDEACTNQAVRFQDPRQPLAQITDTSKVRALQEDIKPKVESSKVMFDMGVPAALALKMNNVHLPGDAETEYPWLFEQPSHPSPFGGGLGGAPPEEPKKPVEELPSAKSIEEGEEKKYHHVRISASARDRFSIEYIERVLDPSEKSFRKSLEAYFISERNAMQDKVDVWLKGKKDKAAEIKVNPNLFLLGVDEETKNLITRYRPLVKDQLQRVKSKLREELGAGSVGWNVTDPMIDKYIKERAKDLKGINTTTMTYARDKIAKATEESIKNGESWGQLAQTIKTVIADVAQIRIDNSRTIARTETGIISSTARFDTFQDVGIEYTQWVNSADEKVRDSHQDAPVGDGGMIVPLGDLFEHTNLMYPLDPSGDVGEIVNCRCVAIASATKEG